MYKESYRISFLRLNCISVVIAGQREVRAISHKISTSARTIVINNKSQTKPARISGNESLTPVPLPSNYAWRILIDVGSSISRRYLGSIPLRFPIGRTYCIRARTRTEKVRGFRLLARSAVSSFCRRLYPAVVARAPLYRRDVYPSRYRATRLGAAPRGVAVARHWRGTGAAWLGVALDAAAWHGTVYRAGLNSWSGVRLARRGTYLPSSTAGTRLLRERAYISTP